MHQIPRDVLVNGAAWDQPNQAYTGNPNSGTFLMGVFQHKASVKWLTWKRVQRIRLRDWCRRTGEGPPWRISDTLWRPFVYGEAFAELPRFESLMRECLGNSTVDVLWQEARETKPVLHKAKGPRRVKDQVPLELLKAHLKTSARIDRTSRPKNIALYTAPTGSPVTTSGEPGEYILVSLPESDAITADAITPRGGSPYRIAWDKEAQEYRLTSVTAPG